MRALDFLEKTLVKPKTPSFAVGDTVDVHVKIQEGERERIQLFTGTVIARKGAGLSETFTVRRLVQGEGVERIFPLHSPRVADVKVKKHGKIRRAKLYYLRGRMGKATKVRERLGREEEPSGDAAATAAEPKSAEAAKAEAKKPEERKPDAKKAEAPAK